LPDGSIGYWRLKGPITVAEHRKHAITVTYKIELAVSVYVFRYHRSTNCGVGIYRILKRPISIAFQESNSAVPANRNIRLSIATKVSYDHALSYVLHPGLLRCDFLRMIFAIWP
jgi:hypothetical protein